MTHAVPPSVPFAWSAHPRSGWAFWWRWVLATNVGWFPGIVLGTWLAQPLAESTPTLAAVAAGAVAGLCFGATQAFALRATLPTPLAWWLATALGWPLGIGAARLLLDALGVDTQPLLDTMLTGFIAGGCVGLPQARLLPPSRGARQWPWVSAISWGLLFPGALAGLWLVLSWRAPDDRTHAK
ncbi:MAG: hypothetical protein JRH16_07220 [Deltaproteobacteria bacterium]|nr:hypothetical protein [Deltaproteobacteria bacterium]MBW2359993.1 hypothetical protein [Deltaproteobacteria bacterium]